MLSCQSMWDGLAESPRAEFLVTPQNRLTRGDLADLVGGMLAVFDANGLVPGSRVLILTRNEGAAITAFIAALLDGLVPVMLTPDTPGARAAAVAVSVAPGLIVMDRVRLGEGWVGELPALVVAAFDAPAIWRVAGFGRRARRTFTSAHR